MQIYKVWLNGDVVGDVSVTNQGLYTRFQCRCQLPDKKIYRLCLSCNGRKTDLGICVPQGENYTVCKTVKSKDIGDGDMRFQIISPTENIVTNAIPLLPDQPFVFLSQLENFRLITDNDLYGIMIENQSMSQ